MKNETAEEWLQKEGYGDGEYNIKSLSLLLERFANHRTRDIQVDILIFRTMLNKMLNQMQGFYTGENGIERMEELKIVIDLFNFHFGITEARNGQI